MRLHVPRVARTTAARAAAVFLLLAAIAWLTTYVLVSSIDRDFAARSSTHLGREVERVRGEIAATESKLDAAADRVVAKLTAQPASTRAAMFAMLHGEATGPRQGIRIVAPNGEALAWWGEDLRTPGATSFEFDATNLYIVRSRPIPSPAVSVQAFERVPNHPKSRSLFDLDDDWMVGSMFHAGVLRQEPGSLRFVLERRPSATLWIDVAPRAKADVVESVRALGNGIAAILLALCVLAVLWGVGREVWGGRKAKATAEERIAAAIEPDQSSNLPLPTPRSPLPTRIIATVLLIITARASLLPMRVDDDPWQVFRFDLFASRILGPFSRSPFDLLLTAAAILAIVLTLTRRRSASMAMQIVRSVIAAAAAAGYMALVRNLVDNSRISTMPDHILPVSAAQGVLLAALLLFGFALIQITRHESSILAAITGVAVIIIPIIATAAALPYMPKRAFLWIAAAVVISLLLHGVTSSFTLRTLGSALLMVMIIYMPLQLFERSSARHFIADTYSPLVVGEAGQLRAMIEDTLHNEFSRTELSSILPDDYRKMNLEDLAYALWLRSDLSKWRVPAVIAVHDIFDHPLSRFGVGLPQFSERRPESDREVLQIGSLTHVLLHHDFDLTIGGIPVAEGSVHVVNPADPGATTFADVYRDFFEPSFDDTVTGLRPQREIVVYDREGNAHGTSTVHLPQSPASYFATLKPGSGVWIEQNEGAGSAVYVRRTDDALYAFPLQVPTRGQQVRRAGGVAIWAIAFVLVVLVTRSLPVIASVIRRAPRNLDFRTRTSLYLTAVVILPLIVFVLFVRAYLANRLEAEYLDRGQTALTAAERVIEDYLASTTSTAHPEQVLDDDVLSWLARVIGHDLHLYRDNTLIASSRRDLFAARVESQRLPGDVYANIVVGGKQLAIRNSGASQFIELYSPINLVHGQNYTMALPLIVQGRQIEAQVNDLATTIYMLLIFIVLAAIFVAYVAAGSVTRPVQALVGGARAVARGDFDIDLRVPSDPDLGLLVTTFRDMAQSIRRQQNDLRHERDRLQTLLENINASVVVLDGAMQVSATNAGARKLFGETIVFHEEVREFLSAHRHRRAEAKEIELNVDGNARTFRVSIVPLPGSDEEMLIAEDVTEILRSNRLEAWGEMARQVAHEIKNPLTPIQLTAEHLRAVAEHDDPALKEIVMTAVDNILRQVVTLRETSKEFSDYASSRTVQRKPIQFRALIEDIAASYAESGERGIDFHAEIQPTTPETFSGDARLLRGAIANLIENAFQAAPGGRVRMNSYGVDSKVIVSVDDDGPGVPPELLPKIFDPYFSTKSSGTGLGLAITRKAIEEHGGSVHAENLNPGFRISLELPIKT
ncbi:MAG: two-component system, NtrC family, nitrogen regulation sensor histidine kinase NtrY [Thermoanaerobaculia bacterium]|jgi:nitrogen fixation/metabolism regulation signal transduction histidine kinase|nr:two-component system, NtrC family, nitrogen regulation sensor histidine kinase NtrY [Thermoanaerobaculia bacterium]